LSLVKWCAGLSQCLSLAENAPVTSREFGVEGVAKYARTPAQYGLY